MKNFLFFAVLLFSAVQSGLPQIGNSYNLSCKEDNDLYRLLKENRIVCTRYNSPEDVINNAGEGSGVLILADGYPEETTRMNASLYEKALSKKLRLYVEYPSYLPDVVVGNPRGTHWERAVISSDAFAPALQKLRILAIHDCRFVTITADDPDIVIARIAGFDSAVYGLPKETFPVLTEVPQPSGKGGLLVATTKLSQFITARYAPTDAWHEVWRYIFSWLQPDNKFSGLKWNPAVRPGYSADEQLPGSVERQVLRRGIEWYFNSRMVMHPSMMLKYDKPANEAVAAKADPDKTKDWPYGHRVGLKPGSDTPVGDGKLGVMEGFDAKIFSDGNQPVRWWRRSDCNGEIAGAMSVASLALNNPAYLKVGGNIGDWLSFYSLMSLGDRSNPAHPAYGLLGWNDVPEYTGPSSMNGYEVYYDDDNARAALGIILAASVLKTDRFDERLSKNMLALMRITGKHGFLPDRINQPDLVRKGWLAYFNDEGTNLSPAMQSYVWAYFLWAYNQTGFDLFLKRTEEGITKTMKTFTIQDNWYNGISARMLLPLAWLVRVEDTPEHRKWLHQMAESLNQLPNGSIREEMRKGSWATAPKSNEEYGSNESELLQTKDDVVSDLLYTANFAFVGLHEAAEATGDSYYKEAEDKLAGFLCRVQIRSETHPELDGGWFRAFDIKNWEYWASNTDAGWGAWCIESGWSQSWITTIFALRQMDTSFWDITRNSKIKEPFEKIRASMLPDNILK